MDKLSLSDLPLDGKKVIMRVDFNVPLNKDGSIADDARIRSALPSIQYVLQHNAALILMSHLGRPKGKEDPKLSLGVCAKRLSELLQQTVDFVKDSIGPKVEEKAKALKPGQVLMLENLRFHDAEEHPDKDLSFAKNLAKLADFYVNDAFGTAHRKHASTYTIAKYFSGKAATGFLIQKEIEFLGKAINNPKRPFYAILGGAKVSTKLKVINNLLELVDALFIGGAMAFTFFKAQNIAVGKSLVEDDQIENVKKMLQKAKKLNKPLYLPLDIVIADQFSTESNQKTIDIKEGIEKGWQGMDCGPKTIEEWKQKLSDAQTIFWNGPLGVFEMPCFAKGTEAIARIIACLPATTIVGGGDSLSAINHLQLQNQFTHLSTGGGASLEYIEQKSLPGIEALSDK